MNSRSLSYVAAAGALVALTVVAFSVGRYPVSLAEMTSLLLGQPVGANVETVVLQVRGPRVLAALVVGAALAAAGTAYQGMFRNPLVSPDILGVSTGAALGAVLGIFLSLNVLFIQLFAFAGGLAAVGMVYFIGSRLRGHDPLLALVLTGVVIGTLLGSAIALLKYLADPYNQLPAITYWLLGSLAAISPRDLAVAAPLALLGLAPMLLLRWRMNLLALPDDEARALGVDTRKLRTLIVAAATLMTAAAVAVSGIIGWVGLLIPHAARLLVGPDFGRLLPLAMLLGAAFLLAVDTLCRTIATIEVPPGVLTALIGTPFFLWLFALAREILVVLSVDKLDFGFPGRTIGRDVGFTLEAGEVMCVLGPNGGGKTTLFRTVLGLLARHAGAIRLEGQEIETLSRPEIARRIGYVPQGHTGYFAYTVREFVLMGRTAHLGIFASPGKKDLAVAARALESLGIAHLGDKPVTEISGGERQLALVARALAQEPKLLVLDEPTASLDFGNQVRVLQRISALAGSGISILFSSHDPDHAFLCARRALLLAEGRVLEIGAPRAVIRPDTLERLYGVSVKVIDLGGGAHTCLPAVGR